MPRAPAEDYCDGFGLTAHELELMRGLPAHIALLPGPPGRRAASSCGSISRRMPDLVRLLSGRENTVRRLDLLRGRLGDAPGNWWQSLIGTPFPGESAVPASPPMLRAAE